MKKFFAALCLIPTLLWGMVFESGKMEDLVPHVDEETWVFIDVDNTLIESSLHLGSAQWRGHIKEKAQRLGLSKAESESILDKFWLFVQPFVPVRLVDPDSAQLIQTLKKSNTSLFALTAREPIESGHTQKQLSSVEVSLSSSAFPETLTLPSAYPGLLEKGVIYCGDNTKSEALIAFFKAMGRVPKKVVFVDDRLEQISALEKTLEEMGIEFVGIRFSAADERVKSFDGQIADLQFSHLPKIVSDEEAKRIITDSP